MNRKITKKLRTVIKQVSSPDHNPLDYTIWGARGVMVIVGGNGHGDRSSNPERD